ncbi:hypothetical protein [Arthrobacter sp. NPDC093139]|uniref:hypothetical protein n=1 Tax=Arthrobacter sp. NPDC093139 TaxID=3363945 RepID=UPI00382A04BD
MDNQLNSRLDIDRSASAVRIDIRGSLTQASRPDLLREIQRVRGMGITFPITVDLSSATFVESSALAGLRVDLNAQAMNAQAMNAQAMNAQDPGLQDVVAAAAGVSLVLMAGSGQGAAEGGSPTALPHPSQPVVAPAPFSLRPLSSYSSAELLAASDSIFELLDDPSGRCGNELLAQYDAIGEELARRELFEATGKQAAGC